METKLVKDSEGVQHQIVVQELQRSCGPACAWMIESAVKRMSMAGGEARIRQLQCAETGNCVSNTIGTPASAAVAVLRATGVSVRSVEERSVAESQKMGALTVDVSRISVEKPALLLFGWVRPNAATPGILERYDGHFVVAARKTRVGAIVLLDPAGGILWEVENNGMFQDEALLEFVAYTA